MNRKAFMQRMASAVVGVGMLGSELFSRANLVCLQEPQSFAAWASDLGSNELFKIEYKVDLENIAAHLAETVQP